MAKGMIIDTTRCTACRGCQSACKQWNLLPGVESSFSPTMTNPSDLGENVYNLVEFYELTDDTGKLSWHFAQKRCLHCLEPQCLDACPIDAIVQMESGAVVVDLNVCTGLQYCGCPFDVLRWERNVEQPRARKCTFCWDRLEQGKEPACAKTCPPHAIQFGDREELLAEAHARIQNNPGKYYNHVYGETEAGGTSIMYLTAVDPIRLGFPKLTSEPPDDNGEQPPPTNGDGDEATSFPISLPIGISAAALAAAGLWYFRAKRTKNKSAK